MDRTFRNCPVAFLRTVWRVLMPAPSAAFSSINPVEAVWRSNYDATKVAASGALGSAHRTGEERTRIAWNLYAEDPEGAVVPEAAEERGEDNGVADADAAAGPAAGGTGGQTSGNTAPGAMPATNCTAGTEATGGGEGAPDVVENDASSRHQANQKAVREKIIASVNDEGQQASAHAGRSRRWSALRASRAEAVVNEDGTHDALLFLIIAAASS
eukprot:3840757-Pleurochrysis_carterae.AAC.3